MSDLRAHLLGQRLGNPLGQPLGSGRSSMPVWPVSFVAAGTPMVASAASGSLGNVGPALHVGDLQVLVQICNSAPTLPTGFTQVAAATGPDFAASLYVFTKRVATAGEAVTAVPIGQATSGTLQAVMLGLRGRNATPVADVVATTTVKASTSNPQPLLPATALATGLALALACPTLDNGTPVYTASAGWSVPVTPVFNGRFGVLLRRCVNGQLLAGTITSSAFPNGVASNWDKATLTFKLGA